MRPNKRTCVKVLKKSLLINHFLWVTRHKYDVGKKIKAVIFKSLFVYYSNIFMANVNKRAGKCKDWFLTYPQSGQRTKEECLTYAKGKWASELHYICVARELHEDGNPHLHIFMQFKKAKQFRFKGVLDELGGKHGKYERAIDCAASRTYVQKGGDFLEWGQFVDKTQGWSDVIEAPTAKDALQLVKQLYPRDYMLSLERIEYAVQSLHQAPCPIYESPEDLIPWRLPLGLMEWVTEEMPKKSRALALIIIGPTRLGKTTWARSLEKEHMYFRGDFALDGWNAQAKLVIFDDCSTLDNKPDLRKSILTQMVHPVWLSDKYRKKTLIVPDKPCIVLSNSYSKWMDDEYWSANAQIVYVNEKMY